MKLIILPKNFSSLRQMLSSAEFVAFKISNQLNNFDNKTSVIERFIIKEKLLKTFCEN